MKRFPHQTTYRYMFGTVSFSFAVGLLLSRYPVWGYLIMGLSAILLFQNALAFATWDWVQ